MSLSGRTDLAAEAHNLWRTRAAESEELAGVAVREEKLRGFAVTDVTILDERGARLLGKAPGRYLRLELPAVLLNADPAFDDIQDSFQYQCAVQNKCDALVTINLKDYRNADTSAMEILSPEAFVSRYL